MSNLTFFLNPQEKEKQAPQDSSEDVEEDDEEEP